ncbi:N-methyl-L-tryptophan oxidase [candidate division KSB1 bacterium]|nr:N-methyl-L-tryptophan oxidase [candidate division KSB1 bacterium]
MAFDVIILGLGAMGSATAYHFAKRGLRVLGLDRFAPPHSLGSSHGESRIIREAYYEHPLYVPLVRRAYELWEELEQQMRQQLFLQTGGLMIGAEKSTLVAGARLSARTHHLAHELLEAREIRRRYPAFHLPEEMVAVWEPRAGVLFPEKCIAAHLLMAQRHGAHLHGEEIVMAWQKEGGRIAVTTNKGKYAASKLVVSAGAWLQALARELALPLHCTRQPLFWFEPLAHANYFAPQNFPIYILEHAPNRYFYGFPNLGAGCKVAIHHEGEVTEAESVRREVATDEAIPLRRLLEKFLPEANGALLKTAVCMYTNTPDGHFLLDFHPDDHDVLIVSPCSGHGFKFSSAIGELIAELLTDGAAGFDLAPFRFGRFASNTTTLSRYNYRPESGHLTIATSFMTW